MPRKRNIKLADPLDFDHEADAANYAFVHDLPGGDVPLTPADLAKRWRTTVDALRKQRERGTGVAFICMNRRVIRYRLLDVVNFEANRIAYSVPQARSIGLLSIVALVIVMFGEMIASIPWARSIGFPSDVALVIVMDGRPALPRRAADPPLVNFETNRIGLL
jgi:hypothetical protein